MDPVANYQLQCTQAEAMVQSYYNGAPPFTGNPACVPTVPGNNAGDPLVSPDDAPFKYAELVFPDGRSVLVIETPFEVKNGPGVKYRVRPTVEF